MELPVRLVWLAVFLWGVWLCGKLFSLLHVGLIGEIVAGMMLGPSLADIVPYPRAFRLLAEMGLVLLIVEGGLAVDITELKKVGFRAVVIAVTGTVAPVLAGMGLLLLLGFRIMEAIAAGCVLSSTSIGMATRLLQEQNQLQTRLGALISAAAITDDILSLVLLSILSNLAGLDGGASSSPLSNLDVWTALLMIVLPIVSSVVLIAAGAGIAHAFGNHLSNLLGAVSESFIEVAVRMGDRYSKPAKKDASRGSCDAESSIQEHNSSEMNVRAEEKDDDDSQEITEQSSIDEVCSTSATSELSYQGAHQVSSFNQKKETLSNHLLLGLLCCCVMLFTWIAYLVRSTHLLGAFIAGVSFARVEGAGHLWEETVSNTVGRWTTRIFFAVMGFVIPVRKLFRPTDLILGLVYTLPSIIGKLFTGVFAPQPKLNGWPVGWAMVARGELGFVMAAQALNEGILSPRSFTMAVWALLVSTLIAPFLFRFALKQRALKVHEQHVQLPD